MEPEKSKSEALGANLSAPFIKRPVMTTLVMIAILCTGLAAYKRLPVSDLPDVDYPKITVTTILPGADPTTMANTVSLPLEKEFMTIPGVTNVTSANTLGNSQVVLDFGIDKSIDSAAQDVEAAISRATPNLPPNLPNRPTYKKVNPAESPIMYIALTSDTLPWEEMYKYGYTFLGQRLSMLSGVAQVITYGSPYAVRVQLDPGALTSRGITLQQVSKALQEGSPNLPSGQLDGRLRSSIIVTEGGLKTAKEYQPLIVSYQNGAPVRIQDIGKAIDSVQNVRFNLQYIDLEQGKSKPAVVLAIQRQPGANTVRLSEAIQDYLPTLREQLPGSIQLSVVFDRADSIRESIFDVKVTLIIALVLVVAVIFLYLGNLRDTIIPSLAMPMSIIATFWAMDLLSFSIDNLSLLALTLATGFIVDDAIVVLENIVRRIEAGESRWEATLKGTSQISFTILSMTLSLIAVFIPMLYMGGLLGKILQEFSITMVIVILASGVISLTLTPMLCSRFASVSHKSSLRGIARWSSDINEKMLRFYEVSLNWSLSHRRFILAIGICSIILSGLLFYKLPKDFIPDDDMGFVIGFTQAGEGTSPERMFAFQEKATTIIRKEPSIQAFVSLAGFPQTRQGLFFMRLKPADQRPPAGAVIQKLYGQLSSLSGANVYIKNIPMIDLQIGGPSKGNYQYTLQSVNDKDLYASAQKLINRMQTMPEFQAVSSDLEINTPQLNIEILRDQASSYGIAAKDIEETLLLAYAGNRISKIQTPYDQYDVILELEPKFQRNASHLSSLYVSSASGQLIPLTAVARWKEAVGVSSVNHLGQFPAVTISFNLAPGIPLGTALETLKNLAEETLSPGVTGSAQGAAQTFEESVSSISVLLVIAVFAIYIVLGILYESFIHPLTILSSLPPAILGGLLSLYLFGFSLSLYGYLGIILLIGIVKKNGIMMIDYAIDNIRTKNESPEKSIVEACLVRFRPIMMTTLAAIMGAVPIALGMGMGADARRPLGLVIIGGLVLSQLITLYLTPVLYLYLEQWNKKMTISQAQPQHQKA